MEKRDILENVRDYSPKEIVLAIRKGVVSFYELKTQTHGQFTPLLQRRVQEMLNSDEVLEEQNSKDSASETAETSTNGAPTIKPGSGIDPNLRPSSPAGDTDSMKRDEPSMSSTQNETVPPPMFSPQVISDTNPDFSQNQDSPSSSPTTPPTVPPPPITPPPASLPTAPPSIVDFESYAHQGNPSNLNSFNWGGFLWGWLWGICNGVYWTLISIIFVIVCFFCAFMTEEGVMPRELSYAFLIITPFVDFVVRIILGISGYQMAWKSKHYESAEKFVKIQKKWTKAGVILFIISVGIVMGLLLMES